MSDEDSGTAVTRERLYELCNEGYKRGRMLIADGKRVVVTVAEDEEALTALQRKFFHGPVLGQISEQVRVEGVKYTRAAWKVHLKNEILERNPRFETVMLPGDKEPRSIRNWWSTEELGVKAYSEFIDEVLAIATTQWRVEFRFLIGQREAVHYPPRPFGGVKAKETAKC